MSQITYRRLGRPDMIAAARVHRAAFDAQLPWLTGLHTPDEDVAYYEGHVFSTCQLWGAHNAADDLIGVVAYRPGWIDQLYVLPKAQGHGVGSALLEIARAEADALMLWTFQRNERARRFYEAKGFAVVRETDGAANEEREPDVLYEWKRTR